MVPSGSNSSNLRPWLTVPVDEEADGFRLLAYMQHINRLFREHKLYPHLDVLRERFDRLAELRRRRHEMAARMPRPITGIDLANAELLRAPAYEDDLLRSIDQLVERVLPELNTALDHGAELRARLLAGIHFEPVGLLPLHAREGYLMIHQGRMARVYAYTLALPAHPMEVGAHHVLRTTFVADHTIGIGRTYGHVKAELIRASRGIPNPAVFAFTSDITLPAIETFVPLAKQLVYEVVSARPA